NRTHSDLFSDEDETLCKKECRIVQCSIGCTLWESALDASCQKVCNKTEINDFDNRQIFCVKGCNDASNFYFQWIKQEVSSPAAPALVPDSLTSTTLSLEWFVPSKFLELAKGNLFKKTKNETYFVQCYEDAEDDWKICGNQTIYENSTIHMERLQPYTKYKFRVALLLSENEAIYSEASVVISTSEEGVPESSPVVEQIGAVDQTRIMVSWKSGLKNNGPILSYNLQIRDLTQSGYNAVKEVPASNQTNYYIFEKLSPSRNYSIQIRTRNARGVGPHIEVNASTAPYLKNDPNNFLDPKIILASENTILSQGPDFLLAQPITFYMTSSKITGIALDVRKKLIFIAEDDGCIYQSSLDLTDRSDKVEVICQKNGLNFKPLLLSVDWLNDHLYIMGESAHHESWTISRCDFDGKKLIVAVGGLNGKPIHIEVDPYNGYLFWVIPDGTVDSGLYRLDLGEISNGIKHETKPFQMIKGRNLGAFIVHHTRFRLLVPMQDENTIMSVSLNGNDQEDIRKNTQSPLLHSVKSLAMANNLFFWTNGKEILTEEYHQKHHAYYHNSYPDASNTSLVAVCVNSSSSQPIPVPVNPPHNCQALLGSTKAKVSWQIPQLVGDQGKGAFKNWFYRLEVTGNDTQTFENITGNSYVVQNLTPNTLYTFKVAAYTSGGSGQWSQEFKSKTLKTSDERYLIWASNDGLLQSDVTGENIITLLPKDELGDLLVTDITWFENILYIVTNTTLKIYNRTNGDLYKLGELDSVGGVAVDWIGRRLYWSNPTQQLINRGRLDGEQQEPLSIVASAREIKIDALRGNIYYSTGLTVESCRLNGKIPKKYFTVPPYSGKQVMGLTLDLDDQKIYWIVRSYQGSSLYSAKLLDMWINESEPEIVETKLDERSLNGPLTHFSDRLVWRQDDKTIVFGDMDGRNLAYFKNDKLTGLTCIMVIDKTHHTYPEISGNINVIPEAIPNSSIKIIGTYKFFNITWNRIMNVNFGNVYYEIKIKSSKIADINAEQTENVFQFPANTLEPYTSLDIFIRAFTFWGSSPISKVTLHSPPGPPSEPTNPRVYTKHLSYPLKDRISISAIFRWSLPAQPNGKILGYKVRCYEFRSDGERLLRENKTVIHMEQVFENLRIDDRYTFEVLAYTSVGEGNISEPVYVETTHERPIPKVLVSTQEEILEVDLDRQQSQMLQSTRNPVVALTHIAHEQKLFWFDENNDLVSYHIESRMKTKLITTTSAVKCMTIDWIERIVYWSQIDDNKGVIYSLNLNRAENMNAKAVHLTQKVLERQNVISDLVISPFDRKLFWIENHKNLSEESGIYYYNLDKRQTKMLFQEAEECMNKTSTTISPIPETLLFATSPINPSNGDSVKHQSILIFEMRNQFSQQFVATDLETKECFDFGTIVPAEGTNLAKDSNKVYWIHGGMVYAREDATSKVISLPVTQKTNKLLAFYQQRYPKKHCLIPRRSNYVIKVVESTDISLVLELPKPTLLSDCTLKRIPIKYTIQYTDVKRLGSDRINCTSNEDCHSINTFKQFETIQNLKPFTNYFIQVAMSSVFDKSNDVRFIASDNFMTEPGRPSPPRNLSALPLSFNEILVSWLAPETFNSPEITYEIHWQQENMVEHIRNKQQRTLPPLQDKNKSRLTDELISTIIKVLPNQSYSILVRAYSKNQTYSESESIIVVSYPEPKIVQMNSTTPTSMIIAWNPPENVSSFAIQYTKQDSNEMFNVTNFLDNKFNNKFYLVDNLEPKTKYIFSLSLTYINTNRSYRWAPTEKIEFETLGDVPSSPGKPIIEHVTETVYKVTWNASKDNGAMIIEYVLESKRIFNFAEFEKEKEMRYKRSFSDTNDVGQDHNEVEIDEGQTEIPNEVEEKPEEKWTEQYRGVESHWIVTDLNPIDQYIFRVRASNSYGDGPYSVISDFLNATNFKNSDLTSAVNYEKSNVWLLMISLPISIILLGLFLVCSILIIYRNRRNKKFHDDIAPIPDFELATLRDLHSGEHLILSNRNILYNPFNGSSFINTEIKHLPNIHLSQIIITDRCLGKGAFGEVCVLMWEVITLGQQPYQGQTNVEVLQHVRAGGRLPRPHQNCTDELYQLMSKCWNRVDQRPTFRYCLEVLQQLYERKNLYASIEAQFPHDVPYKYVSSDDSSILNEKMNGNLNETSMEPSNISQGTPSIPKYIELTYDENHSRSIENMCEAPLNYCEKHQKDDDINISHRNSQKLLNNQDFGYETPITLDPTLDINANNELNNSLSKSRTLSNSSTLSNKSEHFPILPETFPETCKRTSLILDKDPRIYPAKKIITRPSGWV
ncbi:CLUMA_CG004384, isoform A, partial [Clunio marinus]